MSYTEVPFSVLKNQTIDQIFGLQQDSDEVLILTDDNIYLLKHDQDCCESVRLIDIIGSKFDLIGYPIVEAEELTSQEDPKDYKHDAEHYRESFTWTFYKLRTRKGEVVLRWLGESNGYYSEHVTLYHIFKLQ